ncbi:MAG TPA: FkbM family methyltransferase [Allosphingosinicella sp.]
MPLLLDRLRPHWGGRGFLRRFLQRLEVDCVLDVGANVGQYAEKLRLIGYEGLIVSFEPDPAPYRELAKKADSDPKWHALDIALGRAAGEENFNIMARSDFNSFRTPTSDDTHSFDAMNVIVDTVTVQVSTVTEVLAELQRAHGFRHPYLKMDTQGSDLEVFEGAAGALDRIVGIQSEVAVKRIYEGMPDWREAVARYERSGFELAGLFSVTPWEDELVELDCFLVNKNLAKPAGAAR